MQASTDTALLNRADFNAEGAAPRFTYSRSPVYERAFLIHKLVSGEPVAIGDYTVLDGKEDMSLSEKKVINLVSLMNGRKKLMQLGHETNARVLYNIVSENDDEGKTRIVFYHLGAEGVSVENALLRIESHENVR